MNASNLKVGDRIRIISVPGVGIPNYWIHKDTVQVFKKIIARKRGVRIDRIDEDGTPWYTVRFKLKGGKWAWNFLAVLEGETNWVAVRPRSRRS